MARWTVVAAAALATALLVGTGGAAQAADGYPAGSAVGVDISYPSCHTKLPGTPAFGVVGVSGGRVFEDNACAKAEAAKFQNVSYYVNTGLYTGGTYFATAMSEATCAVGDLVCGTQQYAVDAADHAVAYARSQGLGTVPATWWLDVETTNTWDANQSLNALFIATEHDELQRQLPGSVIGVYAVPSQWNQIVGTTWDPSRDYDVWYANGLKNLTATTARQYCTPAQPGFITGGPVVLVQWVTSKTDQDLAC